MNQYFSTSYSFVWTYC